MEHADVMVMLMGTLTDRVLQTADLYHENVASRVWIVEAGMGPYSILEERGVHIMSNNEIVRDILIQLGIPGDSIVLLPGGATSTRMEAEIVRDYLSTQKEIETLLLVTSAEHTRRAYKIFDAAFGPIRKINERPMDVYCSSNIYSDFNAKKWWKNRDDIQSVVMESLKSMNFFLFEKRQLRKEKAPHQSAS